MIATKVYNQQLKKLNKFPKDKADVLHSEAKLQRLGYVDYVKNQPSEVQDTQTIQFKISLLGELYGNRAL